MQLTSAKLGKVMEYVINPKIENKDFDYCVNQVISILGYRSIFSSSNENKLSKVKYHVSILALLFCVSQNLFRAIFCSFFTCTVTLWDGWNFSEFQNFFCECERENELNEL